MTNSQIRDESGINKEYTSLIQKLQENKEQPTRDLETTLDELRQQSDLLFPHIKRPSTLKLDARLLNDSTCLSSINFKRSVENTENYSDAFIEMLITDDCEDYLMLARKCYDGVTFYKTLALVNTTARVPRNTKKILENDTEPEIAKIVHKNNETFKNMEIPLKIKQILEKKGEVEYFRLVINIESFTKTIENIFHLAFAIKQKMCALKYEDEKLIVTNNYNESDVNNHIIFELEEEDYNRIIKTLNIKETLIK